MDYGTFFFTNIVSVTVFTLSVCLLALHNRSVTGMRWFAGGLLVGLAKLVLQGLEGKVPAFLSSMVELELYLISFAMQYVGFHWFVRRRPIRHLWPFAAGGIALAVYTAMFVFRIPYSSNVMNIPCILVVGWSAGLLLRYGRNAVSRASAAILCLEVLVMGYRAWLTNLRYMRPWETVNAETDPRWLYSLAAMAFLASCTVMCYLWFLVTELNRELAEQARTDSLTGALNRRAMEEEALRETARSIRHGGVFCLIMLDIDHFKLLNDTRGHAAGDRALQALVTQVKTMLRSNDLLARTGGEEFTILLPDTAAPAGIAVAERVRLAIEELEVPYEGESIQFTVSAGVAQLDPTQGGWESVMRRADTAMYEAKEHGRNSVASAVEQTAEKIYRQYAKQSGRPILMM